MAKIRKLGNMANSNQRMALYEKEGIAPCMVTCGGGGLTPYIYECKRLGEIGEKSTMTTEINVLGNYMPSEHDASRVVDTNGVAPTVKENHGTVTGVVEIGYLEKGTGKHQSNMVYSEDGLAPTICASYGVKQPPTMHVEVKQAIVDDTYQNREERIYKKTCPSLRAERAGLKVVEIKQATKQGYTECEIGGGMRFELSRQQDKTWQSNRQRERISNSDNGEYP